METNQRTRIRAGDPDAFGLLFEECARAVYNQAFRLTGGWPAAEEAVSLTFLEAWRLRDRVEPEGGSLRPWVLGIALNVTRNLSREPDQHRGKGAGPGPDAEAFTTTGDLLRESIAPPQVSAALYRAAALIPGVTVVPQAVDAVGRPGVAVALDGSGTRTEWIFDRTTLQLLGEREVDLRTGAVTGSSAILHRAVVDHPGQVPAGQG